MDCPNCGVYNPEGRERCWRCDLELPKQQPKQRRGPQLSSRFWLYVALALFAIVTVLRTCGALPEELLPRIEPPSGQVAPQQVPVARSLDQAFPPAIGR